MRILMVNDFTGFLSVSFENRGHECWNTGQVSNIVFKTCPYLKISTSLTEMITDLKFDVAIIQPAMGFVHSRGDKLTYSTSPRALAASAEVSKLLDRERPRPRIGKPNSAAESESPTKVYTIPIATLSPVSTFVSGMRAICPNTLYFRSNDYSFFRKPEIPPDSVPTAAFHSSVTKMAGLLPIKVCSAIADQWCQR